LTPDRWAEVERLNQAALARDVGERVAFMPEQNDASSCDTGDVYCVTASGPEGN
jgi:hypothetical protein